MTYHETTRYTVDRNARLHRPDGTFASRAEMAAFRAAVAEMEQVRKIAAVVISSRIMAAVQAPMRHRVRAFFAPETRPVKAPRVHSKVEERRAAQARAWGFIN